MREISRGKGRRRTAVPPVATARFWRRLERSAVAAHDRQLLRALRHAAADRVPVLAARAAAAGPGAPTALGVLELALPAVRLQLVGVALVGQRAVTGIAGSAWLSDAGRYGPLWWVALASGHRHDVVVLARQVRLICAEGDLAPAAGDPGARQLGLGSRADGSRWLRRYVQGLQQGVRDAQRECDRILAAAFASGNRVSENLGGLRRELTGLAVAAAVELGLAANVPEAQAVGGTVLRAPGQ
jgi:hypothetical protein